MERYRPIHTQTIATDGALRSLYDYGKPDFPARLYLDDFAKMPIGRVSWHWHEQLEFTYVLKGEIDYSVGERQARLRKGEGMFVNAGRLHMFRPAGESDEPLAFSLVFSPAMLAHGAESAAYRKYVLPIAQDRSVPFFPLRRDVPWQREILDALLHLRDLFDRQPFGFELMVQTELMRAWQTLLLNLKRQDGQDTAAGAAEERLKKMLALIQARYGEALRLEDIAAAASVSKSECIRCFKKALGLTPVEYLIEYRLTRAAELLAGTDLPVFEVGLRCGFESASYFAKMFRRRTGVTPLAFRRRREGPVPG